MCSCTIFQLCDKAGENACVLDPAEGWACATVPPDQTSLFEVGATLCRPQLDGEHGRLCGLTAAFLPEMVWFFDFSLTTNSEGHHEALNGLCGCHGHTD